MSHPLCYTVTMKMNEPTYTLWIGSDLAATRRHTTENYIDLLGIASETPNQHVTIYSSREDAPVYDSDDEDNVLFDDPAVEPADEPEENFYLRHDDGGWPGDGSGVDDLADFNQMEGYDYS